MKKKLLMCNEYIIIIKEKENIILVEVNGDKFATIENIKIDEADTNKIVSFVMNEYERWAFGPLNQLKREDYLAINI